MTGLHVPAGPWLRADFGVEAGDEVPAEYDSMFGKLMAWGPDREAARRRLIAALGELRVTGLPSTAPYLRDVLAQPEFATGTHRTTTLKERWQPRPDRKPPESEHEQPDGAGPAGRTHRPDSHEPGPVRCLYIWPATSRASLGPGRPQCRSPGRAGEPGPQPASRPPLWTA